MKKIYAAALLLFITLSAKAQSFSNDWINFVNGQPYSVQQYFKIKVWKDGIYRLTYNDLNNAQFPLTGLDPHKLQIFRNGKEQTIYVAGEADNSFDPQDYIEFYGQKNDGWLDSLLYENANDQLNRQYSMYCDTTVYFLTVAFNAGVTGRRMKIENDVNFNAYAPQASFYSEAYTQFTSGYVIGTAYQVDEYSYSVPKGFTGGLWQGSTSPFPLSTPNYYPGSSAEVTASILNTTQDAQGKTFDFSFIIDGNSVVTEPSVIGYHKYDYSFTYNNPLSATTNTSISVLNPNSAAVGLHISYIKLRYGHAPTFNGESNLYQYLYAGSPSFSSKVRLDITDFNNSDNSQRYIYVIDGDSVTRDTVVRTGNLIQTLVPAYFAVKKCLLAMESATYSSATNDLKFEPVSTDPSRFARFLSYSDGTSNYEYLIVSSKTLWSEAQNYSGYRIASGHNTLLVDIDELYDQFAYGIYKHPLSIKNFCAYSLNKFFPRPKYLFLLGKAVYPYEVRLNPATAGIKDLVPTFGYPCSDIMFSNKIVDTTYYPALATGRLAAQSLSDVSGYLDKIMTMEAQQTQPPEDWMKQVLHFVGGDDIPEQNSIRYFMDSCEKVIEDTSFGANVTSYYKISTDPIQYLNAIELQNRIDSGVTMMTFFGHAAGSTFDIATKLPQEWNNQDRYPLINAFSCNVGDIFSENRLLNEDFVLLPDKGAIGMISKPNLGTIADLGPYAVYQYNSMSYYDYGKTIGENAQHATDSLLRDFYNTGALLYKSTALGQQLHGDPAFKLLTRPKPDLMVNQNSIYFKPDTISTDLATFDVNIIIANLGKAFPDSFHVQITRKFPDNGANLVVDTLVPHVNYKDTLTLTLNTNVLRGAGLNYFDIYVDNINFINETNENNNQVMNVPLLIQSPDISPIYPYKYAIVPNNALTLKAYANFVSSGSRTYKFEIDTTDAFNSPFLRTTTVTQPGGLVKWNLPFTLADSTVYFWRVALDPSLYPNSYRWKESSFQYIPQKTGWEQAHFFQFKDDKYNNIIYNKPNRLFEFSNTQAHISATNLIVATQIVQRPEYFINGALQGSTVCGLNTIHVAVIDSISLQAWSTDQYNFGNINANGNCGGDPSQHYFIYYADRVAHQASVDSMFSLLNTIPDNNYILMYNVTSFNPNDSTFNTWTPAQKLYLHNLGFTSIDTIQNYRPWIFFTKKGFPNQSQEVLGTNATQQNPFIHFDTLVGGNWYKGYITSELIGPAVNWTSLHWASHPLESGSTRDSIAVDVIGVDSSGTQTILMQGIQLIQADLALNINATLYPYLYLRAYIEDDSLRTPRQLDRWQIYYDEVPECVVNPVGSEFHSPVLQQGDSVYWKMPIENISNRDMTPLLVDFYLFDKNNVRHNISSPRYDSLKAGQSLDATVKFPTSNYDGLNSLWIEANPRNDQLEQYHYNNYAELKFNVNRDITNPVLDVTFDGQHILNGDIVSAKPMIFIKNIDENKFLALNDTSKYKVYVINPKGDSRQIYFEKDPEVKTDNSKLSWKKAVLPDNSFSIEYAPVFTEDGIYELRVQAQDESFNFSGSNDYRISFEVITHSSITSIINYPNPFTTSTRFVFTLTGSEIPTYFKIQIMTVTGKIVREITQNELGSIHIGRNITEYAWDGKDEFGDKLARGIYIYRALTSINNEAIDHRATDADKYFTKNWGKMFLLK